MPAIPGAEAGAGAEPAAKLPLVAWIVGQIGLHSAMAGLRMACALQALREGYSAWAVGLLLALFAAAPVLLALKAGRLADRHGYHRPVHFAVGFATTGMAAALAACFVGGPLHFALLCAAAMLTGTGANTGMLTIQRSAGLAARDPTERVRVFSWLGVAPSFSNVVGPVAAGFVIDAAGFAAAYAMLLVLPLATLVSARRVPRRAAGAGTSAAPSAPADTGPARRASAWTLLDAPGMKRLLWINWLVSMGWDVHTFAVPLLGHERGYSASTIGLVLGAFTASVTAVRLVIPLLAHRLREARVVRAAMFATGLVLAAYPFAPTPWAMAGLAVLLGLALGCMQPMILSMLHHITPDGRHGEALAFRSMAINASSTALPLVFGAAGAMAGPALLFWVVGGAIGVGSWGVGRRRC